MDVGKVCTGVSEGIAMLISLLTTCGPQLVRLSNSTSVRHEPASEVVQ
jgi:hypothetical protein